MQREFRSRPTKSKSLIRPKEVPLPDTVPLSEAVSEKERPYQPAGRSSAALPGRIKNSAAALSTIRSEEEFVAHLSKVRNESELAAIIQSGQFEEYLPGGYPKEKSL